MGLHMGKTALTVLVFIATLTAVIIAGALGGRWLGTRKSMADSRQTTNRVLEKMDGIGPGDTLPTYTFYDIWGEERNLRQEVNQVSIISIIEPQCESCLHQLRVIEEWQKRTPCLKIILISSDSPFHTRRILDQFELTAVVLYDHERHYGEHLNISVFPFNCLVRQNIEIVDIYVGDMNERALDEWNAHCRQ